MKSDVTLEDRFARGWGRLHDYSDVEQMEYKSPGNKGKRYYNRFISR